ncbi:hypothetical protein ACLQ29_34435 [Micromonospora sp. DT228]|uniref:hypothetical protein n=1 Tax=Micromonospora sp. DT228 TaxID=3393443 RepID=UPI003CEA114B
MKSENEILELVLQDRILADLLREVCEFDLTRGDYCEHVRVSSGAALKVVAGDFTGGRFFLCGEPRSIRPVLYASSEGQAGLIGRSLAEALQFMVGLPSWWDCLKFSGDGDVVTMNLAAEHLQRDELTDRPGITARRSQLATALSLDLETVPVLVTRLRDVVVGTTPDFVFTDETGEYESLFGPWHPSRNPSWT